MGFELFWTAYAKCFPKLKNPNFFKIQMEFWVTIASAWVAHPDVVLCLWAGVGIKPNKHLNRQRRRGALPPMSECAVAHTVSRHSKPYQAEAAVVV